MSGATTAGGVARSRTGVRPSAVPFGAGTESTRAGTGIKTKIAASAQSQSRVENMMMVTCQTRINLPTELELNIVTIIVTATILTCDPSFALT